MLTLAFAGVAGFIAGYIFKAVGSGSLHDKLDEILAQLDKHP